MPDNTVLTALKNHIRNWGDELGFADMRISEAQGLDNRPLNQWLDKGYHGSMSWMKDNLHLRQDPTLLVEQCSRVISFRMNYLPANTQAIQTLKSGDLAYISRYSLGRDYHKLIRKRLAKIANKISEYCDKNTITPSPNLRAFVDSAPVLEREYAEQSGLGWRGKHTLIIDDTDGSYFFLGEILTSLPLEVDPPASNSKCGDCVACLKVCPTDAFPEPFTLDARRCISYLTIENKGPIAEEFREPMGNRVFGCDDCQLICPWNKNPKHTTETDFSPRHNLDNSDLLTLFKWDEEQYLNNTAGSPIRRIGYKNWLRNLAVGLGNAPSRVDIIDALEIKKPTTDTLVQEHIEWAIAKQKQPDRKRTRKIKNR